MTEGRPFEITPASAPQDIQAVARLFRAYAGSLDVDLGYQDFDAELAGLPGKYTSPSGALLLARSRGGEALGCVALRPMDEPGCCEMKRLFVLPVGRGLGVGRALVEAIVTRASTLGYSEMRLDSLPSMTDAIALYRKCGFEPIAPYYDTPIEGTAFFRTYLS